MYTYSVSGYDVNNKKFSPCSLRFIRKVLLAKSSRCFTEPEESFCGNLRVEGDEECDAGKFIQTRIVPNIVPDIVPNIVPEIVPEIVHNIFHEIVPKLVFETVPKIVQESPENCPIVRNIVLKIVQNVV